MRLSFDLLNNTDKLPLVIYSNPVIENLTRIKPNILVMIDTGASIPVWVRDEILLLRYFPKAYKTNYLCYLGGFGGKGSLAPVYIIPNYKLEDKSGNTLSYMNLPVMLSPRDYSFDMIISFTMLNQTNFSFDRFNSNRSAYKTPKFKIDSNKNMYYIGKRFLGSIKQGKNLGYKILRDIYVFYSKLKS